jgi:ferredoxin
MVGVKILVDSEKCVGHARCLAAAREFFVLDDVGYNRMPPTVVPREFEQMARRGAQACPERAIEIVEDDH